jgi:hypothetical protein
MKKTLIIVILILSNTVFGQIPGKAFEGPVVLFDTLTIKKGDIIYLGKGSDRETGSFINLYAPKDKTVNTLYNIFSNDSDLSHKVIPQQNLDGNFAGSQLAVESFSLVSSRKKGKKILGVINMKENQFTEGKVLLQGDVFLNNVVVDFEPAIRSGEIIKISAPIFTEKVPEREILFSPFLMTTKGIAPVVVAINNLSKNELYNKAVNWTNSYYKAKNIATITLVSDEKININGVAKNIKFIRILGKDLFIDLTYIFSIDFMDDKITMSFKLGGENVELTTENGDIIEYANTSSSHMFNKKGEPYKIAKIYKIEAEGTMNDLSYALVDYLLK